METITVGSIVDKAWQLFKKNFLLALSACFSFFVITLLFSLLLFLYIIPRLEYLSQEEQLRFLFDLCTSTGFWLYILLWVLLNYTFISIIYKLILDAIDDQKFKFNFNLELISKLSISNFLFVLVILIGFAFFILPGFYLAIRLQFIPISIIDKNLSIREAFKESWNITKGHFGQLLLLELLYIGIIIVGILLLFVGVIPAAVLIYNTISITYRDLTRSLEEKNGVREVEIQESHTEF